jgi:hypothetical protein
MDYGFSPSKLPSQELCIKRGVGAIVADYIVGLLEDSEAEDVENHLLECRRCKEKYLLILDLRGSARRLRASLPAKETGC